MMWMDRFKDDLVALETAHTPAMLSNPDAMNKIAGELDALDLSKENVTESELLERIEKFWWQHFSSDELMSLKTEVRLQLGLMPMYERLQAASEAELLDCAKTILHIRIQSQWPLWRQLFQASVAQERTGASVRGQTPLE